MADAQNVTDGLEQNRSGFFSLDHQKVLFEQYNLLTFADPKNSYLGKAPQGAAFEILERWVSG
jgi:hypothetical protein